MVTFDEYYKGWLRHGFVMGVHGGGDNHMTSTGNAIPGNHYTNTNGLTGAYAPARTRRGIWDAYKYRRTFAVSGNQRIFVEFSVNDAEMGSVENDVEGPRRIKLAVAGTDPILKIELFRNAELFQTWRPKPCPPGRLRLVWADNKSSRRTDNSETNGAITAKQGSLKIVSRIHCYTRTDSFEEQNGAIHFRSNGYSGTARGVILDTNPALRALTFRVRDWLAGKEILNDQFDVDLNTCPSRISRPFPVASGRQDYDPDIRWTLEADWVDLDWSKTAHVEWDDKGGGEDSYFVRVEQIDGNIAWSSPVWFRR